MIENFVELCDSLLILYGEYGNQIHGNYLTHWNSFFYVLKKDRFRHFFMYIEIRLYGDVGLGWAYWELI